ncbi:MAG TPA: prenyltransferase [Anaerolineales bacterium]|nr:prenyltransferase [Anaerolineales bacterium]
MSLLANWKEVIDTANLSAGKRMDFISRWLIITRAAVFSMTGISGLIGGLLALATVGRIDGLNFVLAWVGLLIAHASNNMINDFFDLEAGVDTQDYARAQYAPHPILGGLISRRGLGLAILAFNLVDALILLVLFLRTGWPVLVFAALGLFISVFYVAPPIRLKHHGLGEPGVFLVWGPLMIGGTYFVSAGVLPPAGVWWACVPYALVVTTVLIGKHIDKRKADEAKGIRTIPVLIGEQASLSVNLGLMVAYYIIVLALVLTGTLGPWVLLVAAALPRLRRVWKIYREPRPEKPPENYPVWPLWYVAAAFYHNKLAGGMFVLGLALNLLVPWIIRALPGIALRIP